MEQITRSCTLATIACVLLSSAATADEPIWTPGISVPDGPNGSVSAIVQDGGLAYVGGSRWVDSDPRPYVAAFDGVNWLELDGLDSGTTGWVGSLLNADGVLYAGGGFTLSDGIQSSRVARWDGSRWSPVGALDFGEEVLALARFDDGSGPALYAAVREELSIYDDEYYIVRIGADGVWRGLSGDLPGTSVFDGEITDMLPSLDPPRRLYIAGHFGQINDQTVRCLAAWNGSEFEAVGGDGLWCWAHYGGGDGGDPYSEQRPGRVYDLEYAWHQGGHKALFVLGEFKYAGEVAVRNIVAWQQGQWHALPPLEVEAYHSATTWNGELLVAIEYDGDLYPELNMVMRLDGGQQWASESEDEYWADRSELCKAHLAGADRLLLEGQWGTGSAGVPTYYGMRQWTNGGWYGLGGNVLSNSRYSIVRAFADYGEGAQRLLYVAGLIQRSDPGHLYRGIASWDGGAFADVGNIDTGDIRDMLAYDFGNGPRLYVVTPGRIETPSGIQTQFVAAWDGGQWHDIGYPPGHGPFGPYDMEVFDDGTGAQLYVGGNLMFAHWDGAQWCEPLYGIDGDVWSMAAGEVGGEPVLFVGGDLHRVGLLLPNNIAAWDGEDWAEVGAGLPFVVKTLAWFGGKLYAAGDYPNPVVVWDGATWSDLEKQPDGTVSRFRVRDGALLMLGGFEHVGDLPIRGIATYDGSEWSGIEGSPDDVYDAIHFDDGSGEPALYVGGYFLEADGVTSWKIARYGYPLPPRLPADFNNDGAVDQVDLGLLLAAYGTEPGQPFFDVRTDLNRDFLINQPDLAELLGMYGRGR